MAKSKLYFDEVDLKADFPALERRKLREWYKSGIVKKYLQRNESSDKIFSFLDGPITANNPMGVHHAWGRTYKDLWQRFKNMQGYKQRFHNGFDSQGLWVEVEVEKELGFKSKKDIEKYGIGRFVGKCKERVIKYSKIQTEQSKRLGYFMDWDNSYFTMSDDNNYMIWHFLKVCHESDWLYKGRESVPWCPRCETALSQHEILTEDYREVTHKSVYFELPLVGREREFLLIWTTTPWTIPANIAVTVDKKLNYSLVQGSSGNKFWLAKDTINKVFGKGKYKIIKTVKGSTLVGLKYRGPFDHLPAVKKVAQENPRTFHTVVATDDRIMPVTIDEGTGLVHTAVSAGTEDYKLGKKLGLPMVEVIADNADYLEGLGFLSGKNAKEQPELILDYLKKEDKKEGVSWVFNISDYKHRYPVCWRCKTELVWKVTDEWYIAMDKGRPTLRQRMQNVARKINWIPGFGLERELDWLKNMHDWLISKKNRYWGLALPIWECAKCGHFTVIGSKKELKEKAVSGWSDFEGKTPHKPQIDKIKIKCPKCSTLTFRIEPVGNPWLDAGIVAYSTIAKNNKGTPLYLKNERQWRKWFPADFITESFPGQFKNWFYSLIAMSTVLEDRQPFKTVLGFATLFGEDGRPMHKSWGNAIEFNEGADKIGVDVMRWMYAKQNPEDNLLFGYKLADETRRRFHLRLWNVYNFFVTYANVDGWKPTKQSSVISRQSSVLDKWILARLNETVHRVTNYLNDYDAYNSSLLIEDFNEDLSNWYVRRSRERVGPTARLESDKNVFYQKMYQTLVTLTRILAPFIPYLSDVIYKNLTREESVHLANWPKAIKVTKGDKKLINQMHSLRGIIEKAHSERKKAKIAVRQPLQSIKVYSEEVKLPEALLLLAKDELNVKQVYWHKGDKTNVVIDKRISKELKEEADARKLVRKIQKERRNMGMNLTQKIIIYNDWWPESKKLRQYIEYKTLAIKLEKSNIFKITKSS